MDFPTVNATLNATSAFFLVLGYYFIRGKRIPAHKKCMLAAFSFYTLFLFSYLVYHFQVGSVPYTGFGWVRTLYFIILVSHIVLAIVILPLAIRTLYLAWKKRFEQHKDIARWTLPIWVYVSITGVIVYCMLYL